MIAKINCERCGAVSEYEPAMLDGKERFKLRFCTPCLSEEQKRLSGTIAARREAELNEMWKRICPEAYRETDPSFPLMDQRLLAGIMRYRPESGRGIGLYGATGTRKTRMMFLLLHRLHLEGLRVFACSSKRIAGCFAIKYGSDARSDQARAVIRRCYSSEILLLDDLGKQRFSTAGESEFFDLVEDRTSRLRPILWTANATGDELAAMMSADRGGPIVRRLTEFCETIETR